MHLRLQPSEEDAHPRAGHPEGLSLGRVGTVQNSGLGNPIGQAETQLAKSIVGKVDNDVLTEELGNKVFCIFSCDKFLEVIPKESGKGNALKYIMKTSGIKESHSYAFADEENDITLLQAAANSVCMMNGNPKLKAVSDYITFRDNNSDGLADFLELFS